MSDHLYDLNAGIENKVSITIPTYKRLDYAERCIESILEYTVYQDGYEIIISDDYSCVPALEDYLKRMEAEGNIKLILNSERKQCDNAIKAINAATGQFICLMNDDVEIPSDSGNWLTVLVEVLKLNRDRWASVTPAMFHGVTKRTVYWVGKRKENVRKPYHDFLHTRFGSPTLPKEPVWCCYNTFACCLTWKGLTDYLVVGKNNKQYGVDSDWCFEIEKKTGLTHWMVPDTYVYHANIYTGR